MSNIQIVRCTEELFNQFTSLYEFYANKFNPSIFQGYYFKSLHSYIFLVDNQPAGVFGLTQLWPGVGECWFMGTPEINKYPKFIIRSFREFTDELQNHGFHRVQIVVEDTPMLKKWATLLGFEREGLLRKYSINKADNIIYSKVWDSKH